MRSISTVRRSWRAPGAACALALLAGAAGCHLAPNPSDRSLILVTLDTTRADRIGAFGGHAVPTPNLDAAAAEGVVFETAISNVPLTLPAHSTILTGRYPASHGVRHNGIYRLPDDVVTLAERLRDAGFETAAFVGAYVLNRGFGTEQGFETYDDVAVGDPAAGRDHALEAQRSADDVNAAVFRWLDGGRKGKFFLWVHYYDPHIPYAPPERPGRALQGTGYDREISYVDACFGDLMGRLRRDEVLDRSILVVVGDHGESLGEHGEETHGLLLYEGAVHVPMFIRAPGLVPSGRRIPGPVGLVDVAPSVLDLLALPPTKEQEGRSLVPRIEGKETGAGELAFAETLMGRLEYGWSDLYMARSARFKYVQAPTAELYDLEADPGETRNLAPSEPERAADSAASVGAWLSRVAKGAGTENATRTLSAEEEARLRSLGYLGGDAFKGGGGAGGGERPDPKDMIEEARKLSRARARLAEGDATGALAEVEKILAANPRNHRARGTRVEILCRLGRFGDAEEEARAGISLAKSAKEASTTERSQSLELLASTYVREGKTREAEATYREMMRLDPAGVDAAVALARLIADAGRLDEALGLAKDVLRSHPANGDALTVRFVAESKLGRRDDALATAGALAQAQAGDARVLADAGDLLFKAGKTDLATKCYQAAVAGSEPDPLLFGKLGTALDATGRLDEARAAFREAVRLRPQDPAAHYFLGEIALKEGDERQARAEFDEALRRDPSFTPGLVMLGRWLAKNGRREEARQVLEDAVRRNPGDGRAREALSGLQ